MRLVLTGSHGVGKTSIVNGLEDFLLEKGIKTITNSSKARSLKNSGFRINDDATDITELLIASNHISHFNENNWFADRCIIDTLGYSCYNYFHRKISKKTYNTIKYMAEKFVKLYDKIFYVPIEFPMVSDGVRKNDIVFQKTVDECIENFLLHNEATTSKFVRISGSVEKRINTIKSFIP